MSDDVNYISLDIAISTHSEKAVREAENEGTVPFASAVI